MGDLPPNEIVLHSGPAIRGFLEQRQGTLRLTNTRLHYRADALAIHGDDWSCNLMDIARVEPAATLWVVPNKIAVVTRTGKREEFVVRGAAEWVARIHESKKSIYR